MDAPAHFTDGGVTAENLPVANFFAPLVVIDISARAETDPDTQGTPDDITAWEASNGPIPAGAFVALYSGWESRLSAPPTFVNLDDAGVQHYPGWHGEAAALLVGERNIVGAGVDTLSLDYGPSTDFASHLTFLPAGKYGIECLANLAQVPAFGATIIVGGPKHVDASGGPTRAYAAL
jgi:kynurenine formamidase